MGRHQIFHWAWVILIVCFLDLFINYSVRLGYGVIFPEMIKDLGFGRTAGGSIYNSYLLSYIALTPLTGYLTDRFGARKVITTCAFFLGTGVCLMGHVQSLWMACLAFAIAGVGSTGMWTPVITVVQRWFAINRRGMALGILSTGYGMGFATIGFAFPLIVDHFSWRHSWYFLGGSALAMILANGLLLRRDPESEGCLPWGKQESPKLRVPVNATMPSKIPVSHILKSRDFRLIGFSYFCISYGLYGITTFMVDYARFQVGIPLVHASLLATVHGTCQIIGVLTILPLSDYLGRRKTILISNSFITACILGILLFGGFPKILFGLVGLLAVFYGATFPLYGACAGDYFPKEVMGTVIGAWTPFYGMGAILVHWVSGILRDNTGVYDHAFAICVVMAVLGVFFFLRTRSPSRH